MRGMFKSRWIPQNSTTVNHGGNANRSAFHYSFQNEERANKYIAEWFSGLTSHKTFIAERRRQRNSEPTTLVVGDVIYNSWGYEQTNVDFYRVIRKTEHFVWLQEISGMSAANREPSGPMSGWIVPNLEAVPSGEVTRHGARGSHVNFKHGSGSKWEGKPLYNSWYA